LFVWRCGFLTFAAISRPPTLVSTIDKPMQANVNGRQRSKRRGMA